MIFQNFSAKEVVFINCSSVFSCCHLNRTIRCSVVVQLVEMVPHTFFMYFLAFARSFSSGVVYRLDYCVSKFSYLLYLIDFKSISEQHLATLMGSLAVRSL